MAWNGTGIFSRIYNWVAERDAGNNIDATKFDSENDNFATGIQNCLTKDGQNSPTSDLPMGGQKHTGVADGSARTHYASVAQAQDSSLIWGGTSGGTANAQTINLTPAIAAYAAGQRFAFIAGATNTGAATLNVNAAGAKNIYSNNAALGGGEIESGKVYSVLYDGTQFQLQGNSSSYVGCKLKLNTTQSVSNNTVTAISWTNAMWEYGEFWDVGTPTMIAVPVSGIYRVEASAWWSGNANGYRRLYFIDNGGVNAWIDDYRIPGQSLSFTNGFSAQFELVAGTNYQIGVIQTSGGALNIQGSAIADDATTSVSLELLRVG